MLKFIAGAVTALSVALCCSSQPVFARQMRYVEDSFIQMIERRQQITPGDARYIPDCTCFARYMGTERIGNRYKVVFDKLD